jgi:hypothetical protein
MQNCSGLVKRMLQWIGFIEAAVGARARAKPRFGALI